MDTVWNTPAGVISVGSLGITTTISGGMPIGIGTSGGAPIMVGGLPVGSDTFGNTVYTSK